MVLSVSSCIMNFLTSASLASLRRLLTLPASKFFAFFRAYRCAHARLTLLVQNTSVCSQLQKVASYP